MATKPVGKIVLDNPDADDRIALFGYGHTWRFDARRKMDPNDEWRYGLRSHWQLDGCEMIAPLNAITLIGYAWKANMVIGASANEWTVDNGTFRTEAIGGRPAVDWLSHIDSTADEYGRATSNSDFAPELACWIKRLDAPPDQTDPCAIEIELLGDDGTPSTQVSYAITLPIHDQADTEEDSRDAWQRWKHPLLWRRYGGDDPPTWIVVDEWDRADAQGKSLGDHEVDHTVWVQVMDNLLMIHVKGIADWWVYEWPAGSPDYSPQTGKIRVTTWGQAASFNVQAMQYPASGTAEPHGSIAIGTDFNRLETPANVSVDNGQGTVTPSTITLGVGEYRPRLTLSPSGGNNPIVYGVHQYVGPTWDGARSSSTSSDGRAELVELNWRRVWPRGWTFQAKLRDPDDFWLAKVFELGKVEVHAGWDETADTQIMVAYLDEPQYRRDARKDLVREVTLTGSDLITARLRHQFCAWRCNPEGWELDEWLAWMLECAEVPTSLHNITPTAVTVDRFFHKKEFPMSHDTPVVTMIDAVLRAYDWEWATESDGKIWAGPRAEYSGGAVDYILDEDDQTSREKMIRMVRVTPGARDFANMVAVFPNGQDWADDVYGYDYDEASHHTPADQHFRGCAMQRILIEPHTGDPYTQATWDARATDVLARSQRRARELRWKAEGLPALEPGNYVEVDEVSDIDVPAGTVFVIRQDIAHMRPRSMSFRREFRLDICAEWTPP